ncbi:E3 ubiquitin-protein ligase [Nymphaea thermarum]|nr:E3 ubiquitin-protein ligase [Nymphaea thermarum]
MGFPSAAIDGIRIPSLVLDSFYVLVQIKLLITWVVSLLDLLEDADDEPKNRGAPSASSQTIKKALAVVEFGSFLDKFAECQKEETTCAVCLCCIERRHEIRELYNCSHVFHKGCLDKWVDQGQYTCPLCRSPLMPLSTGRSDDDDSWQNLRWTL